MRRLWLTRTSRRAVQNGTLDAPPHPAIHPLQRLQRTLGNRAVGRFLLRASTNQNKLRVGSPGGVHEQEAERVADRIVGMPRTDAGAHKPVHDGSKGTKGMIQSHKTSSQTLGVSPGISADIRAMQGRGRPLPRSVRAFFEPRFGLDLGKVRVHANERAARLNQKLKAQAFTYGKDIYFGAGKYQPQAQAGRRLLAHELTHTIQQRSGGSTLSQTIQRAPVPASINGVTMTKAAGVNDANLKDVVTDVLDAVIASSMDGVTVDAIYVSSVNDGTHSDTSRHFRNLAIDLSRVKTNGAENWQFIKTSYPSNADVKKVVQALQKGFEEEVGSPGVRENFGPFLKKKNGRDHSVGGHDDHIHVSCNA